MGDLLQLSPPELKFRFELRKNIPVTLSLLNPGTERVAFKVKTTSPKKYCVRPSAGYVEPGTTKEVHVIMQAQREYPPSYNDCKDKFKVESVRIGSDVSDVTPELFEPAGGREIRQSKLRVVFVGPPKPPSPVPEGVEEEASPVKGGAFAKENGPEPGATVSAARGGAPPLSPTGAAGADPNSELQRVTRERNRLRDQLAKVESDKAEIKKRLDMVGADAGGRARGGLQAPPALGGLGLTHLLIAALLAFLAGYLAKRTTS